MPSLTLIHNEQTRAFDEHPIETARKALMAAADLETEAWAEVLRRFASTLPRRERLSRCQPEGGA
jgi:hypothetical protein